MTSPAGQGWLVERDAAGFPGEPTQRFQVAPPGGMASRAYLAALLDFAARLGLESSALPDALFSAEAAPGRTALSSPEEILALFGTPGGDVWESAPLERPASDCLTRLFSVDGALEDRDGDLLPDASRLAFVLPDTLPVEVAAELANVAARLGLESGGISFPLVRADGAPFVVAPGDGAAELRAEAGGWRLSGDTGEMARLLAAVASDWPRAVAGPPGAAEALAWLRRGLAGVGPEPGVPGDVLWELQWSDQAEEERLLATFRAEVLPALAAGSGPAEITVFASEPEEVRQRITATLRAELATAGVGGAQVQVLCAFKAGLSWLREVVQPAVQPLHPSRLVVHYRRYESTGEVPALDLAIRWAQELFPGPELLARDLGLPLAAIAVEEAPATSGDVWHAEAFDAAGTSLGHWACSPLWHVQPWIPQFADAGSVCVTTGGFALTQGGRRQEFPVATDLERFWAFWQHTVVPRVLQHIAAGGGAHAHLQPFFGALEVEVWVSEPNARLGIREENDSAAEALHEEIYFGTLDTLELLGQRTTGDRTSTPGAVIPVVHVRPGQAPRAQVRLRQAPPRRALPWPEVRVAALGLAPDGGLRATIEAHVDGAAAATLERLRELAAMPTPADGLAATVRLAGDTVALTLPYAPRLAADTPPHAAPPMDTNIHGAAVSDWAARLAALPEVSAWVEDISYEGRAVSALWLHPPTTGRASATKAALLKPTHIIVARHHANEISSTNSAFQLAWLCATDPQWRRYLDRVTILLLPYENPDGAALHARLASAPEAANWKHHPARYNALGYEFGFDHLDPDSPFGEARARGALWRRFPADVLVDNHGVPSHEWVQPFAGFGSPPRFRVSYWVVQALLYGIASYIDDPAYPHSRATVEALRDAVSARVRDTDIGDWNRVYGASYRFWGQERLPENFPGVFHDDMLWHIASVTPDPAARNLEARYPQTTAISWVTEVNDETADGEHLERVARAHLLANQATLDLLAAAATPPHYRRADDGPGRYTLRISRERPLRLSRER